MLSKIIKAFKRYRFKQSIKSLKDTPFTLISSNCVGRRIYSILHRPYNTPFIGLFLMPECFAQLTSNFDTLIHKKLTFTDSSKYPELQAAREKLKLENKSYPIGLIDEIEIHFLHYADEKEAKEKWERRCQRIDFNHLYFIMIANGPYNHQTISRFLGKSPSNKVFFHRDPSLKSPQCVYIPSKAKDMGNLYSQYQRFVGRFSFSDWLK